MRPSAVQACVVALAVAACRTPPAPREAAAEPGDAGVRVEAADAGPVQPGAVIADVNGTAVVALATPQFAQLGRDQRMFAYWTAQAAAAGDKLVYEQNYRHNLAIARLLRGILSRAAVVPPVLLQPVRTFARADWLD